MTDAKEIIKNIQPKRKAYNRTDYLLTTYKDLKDGAQITDASRSIIEAVNKAVELIGDDPYIDLIDMYYFKGLKIEEIAAKTNLDERTIYRHKKRLVRRLAVIFYGDEALRE